MASLFRLSLVPAFALGSLVLLSGCSSYTTGYYPGRHYGDGVRQHYTNDQGHNVGYTINTRTTGSNADRARATGGSVHYTRAPLARGGYSYSPGVYVSDSSYTTLSVGYTTLGRRHYRHHRGHYGFGHGGYDSYSYGGFGYGLVFGSGYHGGHGGFYGGQYGGHYGGHYSGHGSHSGHGHHGGHGHDHGAPDPDPAP